MHKKRVRARLTDVQCVEMLKMADNGFSAGQIGLVFGLTRNAVIGKVHRLAGSGRLHGKPNNVRYNNKHSPKPKLMLPVPDKPKKVVPPPVSFLVVIEPPKCRPQPCACTIYELTGERCHWPLWNTPNEDKFYCGGTAMDAPVSYCPMHHAIATVQARR